MSNVNTNAQARIDLARQLSQASTATKQDDTEKIAREKALLSETMVHPFTGRTVKIAYIGESFPKYGLTLMDWIAANFVPREEHEEAIAALSKKGARTAPVIK